MATLVMAQDILQGVNQRLDHLWSLTDPARNDAPNPAFALNVKEGLLSFVLLRSYLADALRLLFKELIEGGLDNYDVAGGMCLAGFEAALRFCEPLRKRAWDVRAKGVPEEIRLQFEEAVKDFEQAAADVEGLKREFAERWPWIDHDKLTRSISDERQGVRRRSAKEVFDELRHRVR